jgi:hypothetical protein
MLWRRSSAVQKTVVTNDNMTSFRMQMTETQKCTSGRGPVFRSVAAALALVSSTAALAQTDYDEQIRALEQALEEVKAAVASGNDVQARISAIERGLAELKTQVAQDPTIPPLAPASTAPAAPMDSSAPAIAASAPTQPPTTASSDSASATDSAAVAATEVERGMQGSVTPLRESRNYLTGDDLLDEAFPGSIPIPGSDVRFAIKGYAKLDVIQDFDYVGDRFEFYLPSIPVEGTPEAGLDGRTTFHAKESRISFDFRKKVTRPNGNEYPLQAFLELDFFDDRDDLALQPRLRHAYGVVGRLLAGQTWSTSADLAVLAGLIDFSGGDALYGDRVAQIRWADRINASTTWAIALEDNKSEVGNPLGFDGQSRADTPNLSGNLRWTSGRAHLGLGYDVFGIKWQGGETGPDESDVGWGVALTGRYLLGAQSRNSVSAQLTYGDGSAFKIVSLRGAGVSALLDPNGQIDTLESWQAYAAYNHYWNDHLNSSFVLAHAETDNTDYQLDGAIQSVSSAHVNLIWFPYPSVSTGVELMWGERENKDGATGNAIRAQFMMKYKFN